ncbi:MAG: hypothetical protein KKB81_03430 [Candidatus Margulisbacteria bacterium]|nr:hypothetical protein [Candidatus Margulisiibacteriota bacterium]MBU1021019.1 hypothetical protein [Candidatus Margulisiibacteriota bacterium]MBU1729263.1 hypothetical protein [Candidatus Margulisiibacteriota bacterium]MBU1955536.1 hypothetical protein [Candidatus Margulisiibacteriota bacterium]
MKKYLVIISVIILICFASTAVFANFGARPMALGGAFTAIADDANAAYWNPAGFAINPGIELLGTALVDHRNETIGDNYVALKMCYETPMDSPFGWIIGVGALSVVGLYAAQYLSDQGVLKKNWGRTGEKTAKGESMAEEVKAEDTGETKGRKEIIGEGISRIFGGGSQPAPAPAPQPQPDETKTVVVEKHVYHHGPTYYGPVPVQNPGYNPDMNRPTYYEDREYAAVAKLTPTQKAQFALGLTWMRDNNFTPAINQNTNWYTLSIATAWEETVSLGTNLNFYNIELADGTASGVGGGLDFGILVRSYERLFLGLYAQEILTTDIQWTNGAVTRYEMLINGGIAVKPIKEITLSADMHNLLSQNNKNSTMHFGLELIPIPGLALRGGLNDGNKTAGIGIAIGELMIDYAILGGVFNRTQIASLAWKF